MNLARKRGWTLVEVTIILIVLAILAALLAPSIGRYVHWAKVCRAREDVRAIGNVMSLMLFETGVEHLHRSGSDGLGGPPALTDANRVDLLVGDGDIPETYPGINATLWNRALTVAGVDTIKNHLTTNTPGGLVANRYRTVIDVGFTEFAWRGPYMTAPITADPWGNRYMSNVAFLDPNPEDPTAVLGTPVAIANQLEWVVQPTVVLSAGPDKTVDTPFYMPNGLPGGYAIGNDDIGFVLNGATY